MSHHVRNLCYAVTVLFTFASAFADPQLDLPPLISATGEAQRPTPVPTVFSRAEVDVNNGQNVIGHDEDDGGGGSDARASDYDRDRSERYGPPYNLDNIDRVAPQSYQSQQPREPIDGGLPYNVDHRRQQEHPQQQRPYDERPRILNHQDYPNNGVDGGYNRDQSYPNNGDNYRYFEGKSRGSISGDDERYYRGPGGDYEDRGRFRTHNGDDDKYYRYSPGSQSDGRYNDNRDYGGYGSRGPFDVNGNRESGRYPDRGNGGYPDGNRYDRPQSQDDGYNRRPAIEDDRYRHEQERLNKFETEKLKELLAKVDRQSSLECGLNVRAQWDFETNVNEITQINAVSGCGENVLTSTDVIRFHLDFS